MSVDINLKMCECLVCNLCPLMTAAFELAWTSQICAKPDDPCYPSMI